MWRGNDWKSKFKKSAPSVSRLNKDDCGDSSDTSSPGALLLSSFSALCVNCLS